MGNNNFHRAKRRRKLQVEEIETTRIKYGERKRIRRKGMVDTFEGEGSYLPLNDI